MNVEHGGRIHALAARLGVKPQDICDFSSSLNPLGAPPIVAQRLREMTAADWAPYPDPDCLALRKALASSHSLSDDYFLAGNGSTELIFLIPRALSVRQACIVGPTFGEYERAARLAGANAEWIIMPQERWGAFVPRSDEIRRIAQSDVCFVCNPNNPTGTVLPAEAWKNILRQCPDTIFITDEAFIDFLPQPEQQSWAAWVREFPHLIVLRSFTKFYAIAGLRLGYAMAQPGLIQRLQNAREPWTVNALVQDLGPRLLQEHGFAASSRTWLPRERERFSGLLRETGVLEPLPSAVNYMLARVLPREMSSDLLCRELAQEGILLRDAASFKGLDHACVRVAVKSLEENDRLCKALRRQPQIVPTVS